MEELIDVLNEDGTKTGEIETRKHVHKNGLWHKVIVVAIIDKDGHLLMQKRSKKKNTNPGKWDVSVAGHVSAGQTSIEAAIREVKEEIGISLKEDDLKYMFTYKNGHKIKENYYSNHIFDFYLVQKEEIDLNTIKMQESEVEKVELCDLKQVIQRVENEEVVKRDTVYKELYKYIK